MPLDCSGNKVDLRQHFIENPEQPIKSQGSSAFIPGSKAAVTIYAQVCLHGVIEKKGKVWKYREKKIEEMVANSKQFVVCYIIIWNIIVTVYDYISAFEYR